MPRARKTGGSTLAILLLRLLSFVQKRMRRNRFHEVPKMVSLHHYLAVIIPANGNSLNKSYFAITKHSTITISCRNGVFLILSVSGGD